jgi:hypothetical protein
MTDERLAKIEKDGWLHNASHTELLQALKAEREIVYAVESIFDYAHYQADRAQSRLLKNDKPLYDDSFWQPVLDRIRHDLFQALNQGKEKAPKNEASQ